MTRCVLDWLENAAARAPESVAFDAPAQRMTWGGLRERARSIASAIGARVSARQPVLILMEKSPMCVAAMMGCVYAGCFYTPLDASMPEKRMEIIASVLQPALILTEKTYADCARRLAGDTPVLAIESLLQQEDEALLSARRAGMTDTDLLYVLFTSGSTGVPKGVAIMHRSVVDFVEWAGEALRLPEGVRFGSQAPFYFDNSVLDIYCAMKRAGSVYLIPKMDFMFPRRLMRTLDEQRIDTIFWVPSALTAAADALDEHAPRGLLRVFFCGEVMPCRTLNHWKRALPNADYVNMYGPTEITDVCAWYRVEREFADTDSLPIGAPCANTRIELLDGEICVMGTCLSSGYYNAPEKTAQAFIPNPLHPQIREMMYCTGDLAEYNERGELMFLGRKDQQIKRSGYRIELGEIECAMGTIESIGQVCCCYDEQSGRIIGAYTGAAEEKRIKAVLKALLPKYMMPDRLVRRQSLPRTGSGKLDRLALKREVEREYPVV